jgi:hypothetical protein
MDMANMFVDLCNSELKERADLDVGKLLREVNVVVDFSKWCLVPAALDQP